MLRLYPRVNGLPLLALLLLGGCSSPPAKPDPEPRVESKHKMINPVAPVEEEKDDLKVEGTLGTIEEEAIHASLDPRLRQVNGGFQKKTQREPYLSGKLVLHFRVTRTGTVKRARIAESTLGSVSVERCILGELRGVTFARPKGGEAEFSYPLVFQGRIAALQWESGMVKDEILSHLDDLLKGPQDATLTAPKGLVITFYLDQKGKVVSVGLSADEVIEDSFADPFVENLKRVKFVEPAGAYAKVSYPW
jgi:hypothetical protein